MHTNIQQLLGFIQTSLILYWSPNLTKVMVWLKCAPWTNIVIFPNYISFALSGKIFIIVNLIFPQFTLVHELKNRENLPSQDLSQLRHWMFLPRIWASYVTEPTTKNQPLEKEPTFLTNLRLLKKKN